MTPNSCHKDYFIETCTFENLEENFCKTFGNSDIKSELHNRDYLIFQVKFVVADALKIDFEPNSFDIIYSRDTILHIPEKDYLFKQFNVCLFEYCNSPQKVKTTSWYKIYFSAKSELNTFYLSNLILVYLIFMVFQYLKKFKQFHGGM